MGGLFSLPLVKIIVSESTDARTLDIFYIFQVLMSALHAIDTCKITAQIIIIYQDNVSRVRYVSMMRINNYHFLTILLNLLKFSKLKYVVLS